MSDWQRDVETVRADLYGISGETTSGVKLGTPAHDALDRLADRIAELEATVDVLEDKGAMSDLLASAHESIAELERERAPMKGKTVAQLEGEHRAWLDEQHVSTLCGQEGCAWTFEGTAAEGRHAHAEHRARAHPELARKPRRRRERTFYEQQAQARRRRIEEREQAA